MFGNELDESTLLVLGIRADTILGCSERLWADLCLYDGSQNGE